MVAAARKTRSAAPASNRSRPKTLSLRRAQRLDLFPPVDDELFVDRPTRRSDCLGAERPCPWVACKHHLYLDVNPDNGSIKLNFPDLEPHELPVSCALDVADAGGVTLEEVGELMQLTRERVRQVEVRGLLKLKMAAPNRRSTLPMRSERAGAMAKLHDLHYGGGTGEDDDA